MLGAILTGAGTVELHNFNMPCRVLHWELSSNLPDSLTAISKLQVPETKAYLIFLFVLFHLIKAFFSYFCLIAERKAGFFSLSLLTFNTRFMMKGLFFFLLCFGLPRM